jgi:DNA polymerase-3 subunit epsilon
VADEFLAFIEDATLVIHNADFDMGFINMELKRLDRPVIGRENVVDTVMLARRKHPGAGNRLDDLCARYGIDNSRRTKHGALLDSELLAEVYIELIGGRQTSMELANRSHQSRTQANQPARQRPVALAARLSAEETEAHLKFIEGLGKAQLLWKKYEL